MSSPIVLDASALIAIALGEQGDGIVADIMDAAAGNCFIHAINAFEVAYKLFLRTHCAVQRLCCCFFSSRALIW